MRRLSAFISRDNEPDVVGAGDDSSPDTETDDEKIYINCDTGDGDKCGTAGTPCDHKNDEMRSIVCYFFLALTASHEVTIKSVCLSRKSLSRAINN